MFHFQNLDFFLTLYLPILANKDSRQYSLDLENLSRWKSY